MVLVQVLHKPLTIEPHPHFIILCPMILIHHYIFRNSILYRPRPRIHITLITVYEVTVLIQRNLPFSLVLEKSPDWHAIWPWSRSLHRCHLISPQIFLIRGRRFLVQPVWEIKTLRSCPHMTSILLLQKIFHDMKRDEKCKSLISSVPSSNNSLCVRPKAATEVDMDPFLRDFSEYVPTFNSSHSYVSYIH